MIYTCEVCATTFEGTAEAAFDEGWDTPERFLSHCTCPNCTIDKTTWWRLVVEGEKPSDVDIALIQSYNDIYYAALEGKDL